MTNAMTSQSASLWHVTHMTHFQPTKFEESLRGMPERM